MVPARVPRVYFYCRNEEGNFQEDVVTLAEGLRALGVPFFGSCDYWRESVEPGSYLIRHDPEILANDCDIVVVSYTWPYWIRMRTFDLVRRPLPEGLFRPGRRYVTVYMDSHDGHRTVSWEPEFRRFELILRSKLNRRAWHPENMRPWVLGFSDRIYRCIANGLTFDERRRSLLWNFGASHPFPHGTRVRASGRFLAAIRRVLEVDETRDNLSIAPLTPYDALMWCQTGGRHAPAYYERLKRAAAVACFCGDMIPPMPFRAPERYLVGGNRARIRRVLYEILATLDSRAPRVVQWDSFRFWEALVAGCAAFHVELDRGGVQMPVMPENWAHYIGVDLDRPTDAVERIEADPGCLERIAAAGRGWALEHYSPRAMAARFLAHAGFPLQGGG